MFDSDLMRAAFSNLATQVIAFLPTMATALVVLFLGWLLARALSSLTKRAAERLGIDLYVERSGISEGLAQARIERTPSDLLHTLVYWLVFLSAILVALEHLGLSAAFVPLQGLIAFLPRVLAAILVLIVGAVVSQWVGQATRAAVASLGVEFHRQIGKAVRFVLLTAVGIMALQQLGLDLSLFTGALVNLVTIAAAGFALSFALGGRSIVQNILAGFYAKEIFSTGDTLTIDDVPGTLEAIGVLNAEIAVGEEILIMPNCQLIDQKVRVARVSKGE